MFIKLKLLLWWNTYRPNFTPPSPSEKNFTIKKVCTAHAQIKNCRPVIAAKKNCSEVILPLTPPPHPHPPYTHTHTHTHTHLHLHLHLQWLPTRSYNGHSVGGRSGLIYMVSLVLNSSVLLMSSTAGGSLFHSRMVRGQKLFLYSSQLLWIVRNFMGWDPLVLRSGLWVT